MTFQDIAEPQFVSSDHATARRWLSELEQRIPDAKIAVTAAVEGWRRKAREALTRETALRMTSGDRKETIPIRVIPGLPERLVQVLDQIDPDLLFLVLNRNHVRAAARGLRLMDTNQSKVDALAPHGVKPVPWSEIVGASEAANRIANWLDTIRIPWPEVITNRDVLGAYWYRKPEITIHWEAIGIACMIQRLPVAEVTATVLFHELAHAWHHRGFDIDGRRWDTESFANSDPYVVEGVAQFYAWLLTAGFAEQQPDLQRTWDAMEALDKGPYVAHIPWKDLPRGREVIRAAMLDTRMQSRRGVEFPDFEESIRNAQDRINAGTSH